MKHYLIYQITNVLNEMIYVGCHITEDVNDDYMGSGTYLLNSQRKNGIHNFKKEILFECKTKKEMLEKEAEIVNEIFIEREDTYNLTIGGYGGFYYSNKTGANHRHLGLFKKLEKDEDFNIWFRDRVSEGVRKYIEENGSVWNGKKHKEETKRKIGEKNKISQSGERNSQYGKCWICKEKETKSIKKNELQKYLDEGWKKGRRNLVI